MNIKKIIFYSLILLLVQFSCTEIIDPDISGERVIILAPADNLVTCNSKQTFWWDYIAFAERYNIQIVEPDFQNTETLVLDSILTDNKFEFSLAPGNYQWRVAAMNNNTMTNFTVYTIVIDSLYDIVDPDISNEIVVILAPIDNYITSNSKQTFWWEEMAFAKRYNIQIVKPNFQNTETLVLDSIITDNKFEFSLSPGNYQWRVAAMNDSSRTDYAVHTLSVDSLYDIVDPDISNEIVVILAPIDNYITCSSQQTFWWEEMAFAKRYNIQIVKPNFQNTETLVLDSIITDNKFEFSLSPGNYQWRVAAMNDSSRTDYAVHNLSVDSQSDFSTLKLSLLTPTDGTITNESSQMFLWQTDSRIKQYDFCLYYKETKVLTQVLSDNTYQENLIWGDGEYKWSIQGHSLCSNTAVSMSQFTLDTQAPAAPILIIPSDRYETNDSIILFQWDRGSEDIGSELTDSLFVYSDSLQKNIVIRERLLETSYQDTLQSNVEYFWQVRTVDAATNLSDYSKLWRFKIIR